MRIEYLADHPRHAETLARWHHAAWGELLIDWSVDTALSELRSHRQRRAIPTTMIALEGDEPVASVSLLVNDHERIRKYSPWLASLYVRENRRGLGLGQALARRAVQEAAELGVEQLYLYTTDAAAYYERLGWVVCDRVALGGTDVAVMTIAPLQAALAPLVAPVNQAAGLTAKR